MEKLGLMVVIQAGAFPLEGLALLKRADRVERMIVISHGRPVERLGPFDESGSGAGACFACW